MPQGPVFPAHASRAAKVGNAGFRTGNVTALAVGFQERGLERYRRMIVGLKTLGGGGNIRGKLRQGSERYQHRQEGRHSFILHDNHGTQPGKVGSSHEAKKKGTEPRFRAFSKI